MLKLSLKSLLFSLALATSVSTQAQIAQEPLLNKPNTVAPNLTLILDTSGSMAGNYIYQFGTPDSSGMGPQGPGTLTYASKSPDVNRIYYDPRTRYEARINYDGTLQTPDAPAAAASGAANNTVVWTVYFRNSTVTSNDTGALSEYHTSGNPAGYTPPLALLAAGAVVRSYPNNVTKGILTNAATRFPKFLDRSDCVTPTAGVVIDCTATEEAQNYSNWKKWYSTRGEMMKSGLGYAFQPLLNNSIRLGWSTISQLNSSSILGRGVSLYDNAASGTKNLFYNWLYGQSFGNGTPNLVAVDRVGKYYQRKDNDGPWANTPDPASTGIVNLTSPASKVNNNNLHASCRRSFSMLLTDGYWNGTQPSTGNVDGTHSNSLDVPTDGGTPASLPYVYTPKAPYSDNYSDTLADIAMYYWLNDARPDILNRVPKINTINVQNESYWQNVSFYAITLGIDGTLPQTSAIRAQLDTGSKLWPQAQANKATTIDDTWHATINGRGEMLNAFNATELTSGLKSMFASIAGAPQTLSGIAVSTAYLSTGTRKYKPEYVPGSWSGKLAAVNLNATTGADLSPDAWQVESGAPQSNGYDPITTIPAFGSRNVWTWSGTAGVAFNTASTGLSSDLVNYLKGDYSKEVRKSGGIYRNREALLGDIINSSPVFVKDNVDMGYGLLLPAGSFGNYSSYLATKALREGVLFVGANDGMLHGFRDSNGSEVFAYVPKAVIPNLYKLADPSYGTTVLPHQYYVDGPSVESDAYLGGNWKNVLLGSTGAGAKSVFALDVTSPLTMNASSVLWEVNTSSSGFAELGHVLSEVEVGILANGNWVAIFGNGFGSASGIARLFVVDLATGALLKDLNTGAGGSNGLGGVRVVRDTNKRIIGAYAGDLKGNLWKFDLSGSSSSAWTVGLSGSPLFVATDSTSVQQPITAAPAVFPHTNGGYVVTFGTGKFFETADLATPYKQQRIYGVWDAQDFGSATVGSPLTAAANLSTQFVQQVISPQIINTVTYFNITSNPVSWGNGTTGIRGWYIDLPNSGERLTYAADRITPGTFILVTTLSPVSMASADPCQLSGSGTGYGYIINGMTGAGPTKPTFNTNTDTVIDAADQLVSGYVDKVDGVAKIIYKGGNGGSGGPKGCIVTTLTTCRDFELPCGQDGAPACPPPGVATIKSREWRQLFMR